MLPTGKRKVIFLLMVVLLASLSPAMSRAEFYIAGMGGYVFPNDFSNVSSNFPILKLLDPRLSTNLFSNDIDLDNAPMGGGKIGYYFPQVKWLGVETEGFFTTLKFTEDPDPQQIDNITFFFPSLENLQVTTWAFNAVVRYPHKRFQPYVGVGLGVFFGETSWGGTKLSDNWVPGFNALAGIRGFITEYLAVFAEYKYNYVTFNLESSDTTFAGTSLGGNDSVNGTYSANMIAGGISFHFNVSPFEGE